MPPQKNRPQGALQVFRNTLGTHQEHIKTRLQGALQVCKDLKRHMWTTKSSKKKNPKRMWTVGNSASVQRRKKSPKFFNFFFCFFSLQKIGGQ
jgi:hypothetical protein